MVVTLYLTRNCNQVCSYCYAGARRAERMSRDVARAALALGAEHSTLILGVRFFGGEPLLEWDLLRDVVDIAKEVGRARKRLLSFTINTNATLLRREHIRYFEEENIGVGISMDGTPAVHNRNRRTVHGCDTFAAVREGYGLARSADIRLAVELVLDPSNVGEFAESVRFLVTDVGVRFLITSINIFASWQPEHMNCLRDQYAEIAAFYRDRYESGFPFEMDAINNKMNVLLRGGFDPCLVCHLGKSDIAVVPDGRIYPCLRLVGWDEAGTTVIGHVSTGLDQEKAGPLYRQSRSKPSICVGCENDGLCTNWCASTNLVLAGSLSEVGEFLCAYERIVIDTCRGLLTQIDLASYRKRYREYLTTDHCEPTSPHRMS